MVRLTCIYTRGGDKGKTSLGNGVRVDKHALRVEAYGTVDEANAAVGIARQHVNGDANSMLARIQNDLFDLGADLCTPEADDEVPGAALRIVAEQVLRLESEIDTLNADLKPLTTFVLPGGSAVSAYLHLGRTIVRRAERLMTALAAEESVNPQAIAYINRLSDHLFVAARWLNAKGAADILWVPGANR